MFAYLTGRLRFGSLLDGTEYPSEIILAPLLSHQIDTLIRPKFLNVFRIEDALLHEKSFDGIGPLAHHGQFLRKCHHDRQKIVLRRRLQKERSAALGGREAGHFIPPMIFQVPRPASDAPSEKTACPW